MVTMRWYKATTFTPTAPKDPDEKGKKPFSE